MMNGIEEVNIEGVATIGDRIILANRGNQSNPKNHLIIITNLFWERQQESTIEVAELALPMNNQEFVSVSEVHYSETNDVLFLSFST